jgi:MYXO-CTERM domain-containing protein
MRTALILTATLAGASTAHALNQSKHYDVTVQSCTSAGLPDAFCKRVGVEVYNVDANEFNDLAAHSQIENNEGVCAAAVNSTWRVFWLGGQLRAVTIAAGYSPSQAAHNQVAQHLGRALHTLQDDCAHHGMPNPQHAWHSLSDVCRGTSESPDLDPAAFDCASQESDAAFSEFIDVLHDYGGDFAQLSDITDEDDKHWPSYSDVCDFLGSAGNWDGQDRRWNMDVVRPALAAQFAAGLGGADASQYAPPCTTDDDVTPPYSAPDLDTSGGAQSCVLIHTFCLGKADENAAPQPPPWEPVQAPAATQGGCSFTAEAPPPSYAVLLFAGAVAALLTRRRRP